ncbi:MAG: hypothetical protein R3285_11290, partial [Kiloniellales bacterium]|nr:hypothetical protein [Kiloniellales bacterium]
MSGRLHCMRAALGALAGLVLLATLQAAAAEEAKPQEWSGLSVDSTDLLPLAAQIPTMDDHAPRIRQITMAPGAVVVHHSHAERPIAAYAISGAFTEVPDDGPEVVRGPGSQWVEGAEMRH